MIVNETECFLLRIAIFMEILDQRKTGTVNCIMGLFGWRILIPLQRNSVLRQNQSSLTSNHKMTNNILSYSLNNQDLNDIEEVRIQLESSNTNTCSELSNKSFLSSKNRHFEVEAGRTTFMRKGVTFANKQKKRKTKQKKIKTRGNLKMINCKEKRRKY